MITTWVWQVCVAILTSGSVSLLLLLYVARLYHAQRRQQQAIHEQLASLTRAVAVARHQSGGGRMGEVVVAQRFSPN